MALACIKEVTGRGVVVPGDDIDTDRIIPARFLRCVTFDGLGEHLFRDVRVDAKGQPLGHPLDDPRFKGATILISGRNFGCGSSREHAPQALAKFGIRAVLAESFAEIFFGNATALGVPCVSLERADLTRVAELIEKDPTQTVTVNLTEQKVVVGGQFSAPLQMKPAARQALTTGFWDPIGQLLEGREATEARAKALPYLAGFAR